ncbi:MAG: BlaI/MecI/CopY family transcriptional regulator, partial [bacterium]
FIQNASSTFSSSNNDTNLVFELNTRIHPFLFLTPEELHDFTPVGPDPLGDELRRKFNDIPPTVSLSQLFRSLVKKSKKTKRRMSISEIPIPTNLEIDILKILWTQSLATPSDIYAKLDTTWPITSEDLHAILEEMTNRGFLDRKKISPSHEFSLFGFAQIEMSSKNRKNKVYVYWPIVPKEKLITYLDAKRYLAFDATQKRSSNGESNHYYKILEDKLIRLVK